MFTIYITRLDVQKLDEEIIHTMQLLWLVPTPTLLEGVIYILNLYIEPYQLLGWTSSG